MKRTLLYFSLIAISFTACQKNDDIDLEQEKDPDVTLPEEPELELEVEEFIYRGMEEFYLYEADVPVLQDGFFDNDTDKQDYLASFDSPENLFYDMVISSDRFSFITDDYNALNDSFDGKSGATGMEFGIGRITDTNRLFGFIQYILPQSSAEEAGLTRGTLFTQIDGTELTNNNYQELLSRKNFTINIAGINKDGFLEETDETVALKDEPYTSNPILINKVIEIEDTKIGYLMYNSFIRAFDDELNAVFGEFKSENIEHLILDLRYNGGGAVMSAVDMASMITGQFEGEVFMKEQWNDRYQTYYETYDPEVIYNYFDAEIRTGEAINSLKLSEVYILSGYQTASASELIINGLKPYINVIQIGEQTTGKFQGSITVYDAPQFNEDDANPDHTYALQPLVFTSANANGDTGYVEGLHPTIELNEDIAMMGELGDLEEPLLKRAIDDILGNHPTSQARMFSMPQTRFEIIGGKELLNPRVQEMYLERTPPTLLKSLD